MNKIILTAIREFKATALTPAFLFGAVILPLVIWGVLGAAGAAGLFSQKPVPTTGTIALVDPTESGRLTELVEMRLSPEAQQAKAEAMKEEARKQLASLGGALGEQMGEAAMARADAIFKFDAADITVERLGPGADLEPVRDRVRAGELLGLFEVSPGTFEPGGSFISQLSESAKARDIKLIENAVADSAVDVRIIDAGMSAPFVRTLMSRPRAEQKTLTAAGGETKGSELLQRFLPIAFLMFLAIAIFTGGGYLLMSTVEEKSSRIMEVLLSSMSPMQLMTGKIIGQGFVGLMLLLIYGGLGVFAAIQFAVMDLIPLSLLVWLVVYFLMGYFIYAAINAAIGSAVNEAREAQALQGPILGVTILVMYLGIFSVMMSDNPHSTLARALSFFPPATPFVMSMRVAYVNDPMPTWELAATTAVGVLGMIASVWAAAKIFRVGVLMYGQPPTIVGLVKWLRYT